MGCSLRYVERQSENFHAGEIVQCLPRFVSSRLRTIVKPIFHRRLCPRFTLLFDSVNKVVNMCAFARGIRPRPKRIDRTSRIGRFIVYKLWTGGLVVQFRIYILLSSFIHTVQRTSWVLPLPGAKNPRTTRATCKVAAIRSS